MGGMKKRTLIALLVLGVLGVGVIAVEPRMWRYLEERRMRTREDLYHGWLAARMPGAREYGTTPGATRRLRAVMEKGAHHMMARIEYVLPLASGRHLLKAIFTIQTGSEYQPMHLYSFSYVCVRLDNAAVYEKDGVKWRRYQGAVVSDRFSVEYVGRVVRGKIEDDLDDVMSGCATVVAEWRAGCDPYERFRTMMRDEAGE